MRSRAKYQANLYSNNGSLEDCSDDFKTRKAAIDFARDWLDSQPVGAFADIERKQVVTSIDTRRKFVITHTS